MSNDDTLSVGQDATYRKLLDGNQKFIEEVSKEDPGFFERLSAQQTPKTLWIGCADSRVPADKITSTLPGELFVHRNVANVVCQTDMNCLTCLEYAVSVLKVEHVIVCGHYGCGGVLSAMGKTQHGFIDNWLSHIKDVYRLHDEELDAIEDEHERGRRFVELNVFEQALNVCKTATIQNAWRKGEYPFVHGWVYDLSNGVIKDLKVNARLNKDLSNIYKYDSKPDRANESDRKASGKSRPISRNGPVLQSGGVERETDLAHDASLR